MMELYVNPNGSDTSGIGSVDKPYKTIAKAISNASGETDIYLGNGIHTVYSLLDISSASSVINFYGNGLATVIEVQYCYTNGAFKNKMTINNCVIRPVDDFTGDRRALSYTSDVFEVRFNYVLFTKSLNKSYPTTTVFYFHNNTANYICNKIFKACTFISDTYIVSLGGCSFTNCTTNYSVINQPGITVGVETNSLYNQVYDNKYSLLNSQNKLYGVYSKGSEWNGRALIFKNNKYYNIVDNKISETTFNYYNGFDLFDLNTIDKFYLKTCGPFKIILFNTNDYSNLSLQININTFVLINLNNINYRNIKLEKAHKMLVSNDLKTWYNYNDDHDYQMIYTGNYKDYFYKDYINENCKLIKEINNTYNYIFIKLNNGETFNKILEEITIDFKRIQPNINIITGVDNKALITVPDHCDVLIVKLINYGHNLIVKDSLEMIQ